MRKYTPPVSIPGVFQDIGQIMTTECILVSLMCGLSEYEYYEYYNAYGKGRYYSSAHCRCDENNM